MPKDEGLTRGVYGESGGSRFALGSLLMATRDEADDGRDDFILARAEPGREAVPLIA